MNVSKLMSVGVIAVLFLATACDNDKKAKKAAQEDDAGADTAAEAAEKPSAAESEPTEPETRPSATASKKATVSEKPPLAIDSFLTTDDVGALSDANELETGDLVGVKPSPTYNARRIYPADGADYGAGLQVWSFEKGEAASNRIASLKPQYLNVSSIPKDAKGYGDSAFVAKRSGIRNFVFHTSEPAYVAAVSCSVNVCKSNKELVALADKVKKRLQENSPEKPSDE